MSKFNRWAQRTGFTPRTSTTPAPAPQATPVQTPQPAQGAPGQTITLYQADGTPVVLSAQTPAQAPQGQHLVAVHRPAQVVHPNQVRPRVTKHAKECMIVKEDDHEGYTKLLHQLPDLVASGQVANYNQDNANALQMSGVPDGAAMEKWTPNARYYNGATDAQGRQVDDHLGQRYGESLAGARSARSTVTNSARGGNSRID